MKKIQTRAELAEFYNVSVKIMNNWIKEIITLNIKPYQRILTPKQIQAIIEYLGTP